jgi:hypothetical protein
MKKLLFVVLGISALYIFHPEKPPFTEAELAQRHQQNAPWLAQYEAQQKQQMAQRVQKQACDAKGGHWSWSDYRKACEEDCDYECIQNHKWIRKWDRAMSDAMNPWKD